MDYLMTLINLGSGAEMTEKHITDISFVFPT